MEPSHHRREDRLGGQARPAEKSCERHIGRHYLRIKPLQPQNTLPGPGQSPPHRLDNLKSEPPVKEVKELSVKLNELQADHLRTRRKQVYGIHLKGSALSA